MSKRGSGSSARTGDVREVFSGMKEAMEPFEKNFPKLEGTEKQVAWAEDIRNRWIKNELCFEPLQTMYKENAEGFKRRYEKLNAERIETAKRRAENRKNIIKAARFTLEHMTKAKDIIEHRTAINDIVNDVSDGLRESKRKALNALKDWLE